MNYDDNKFNKKLFNSIQIINVCIGVIITLMCIVAYMTIEDIFLRFLFISIFIILAVCYIVHLCNKADFEEVIDENQCISKIQLVNENNEIISDWIIGNRISFVIGKSTINNDVFINLNNSVYSKFIEENHAVVNYAAGKWYIEDLSSETGVCIQKAEDKKIYRIVKDTPCEIKKGDILFIHKVKLLLK